MERNGTDAVSVIIPTYNRARYIDRSIRSALAAVSEGDEIIIVDDGSTDDTASVVAPWLDRVRYVRIENRGAGGARNVGVSLATKPLVAFLDSDDEWFADKLALQRPFMAARPDVLFCFSDFAFRDEATGKTDRMYLKNWHNVERPWEELLGDGFSYSSMHSLPAEREDFLVHVGDLYPALIEGPFVAAWTSLIRREMAGDALHFQEGIKICEDWWCYARLARAGRAAFFACETAWNHGHAGPRVTDANQYELLSCRIDMTEQLWGRDQSFLQMHADLYNGTMRDMHLSRAKWLLSRGRMSEARRDLHEAGEASPLTRALAAMPAPVATLFGVLRRTALGLIHGSLLITALGGGTVSPDIDFTPDMEFSASFA